MQIRRSLPSKLNSDRFLRFRAVDRAAAQAGFAVIEHDPLTRRDRTLRRMETNMRPRAANLYRDRPVTLAITELCRAVKFGFRRMSSDPVDLIRIQRQRKQFLMFALLHDQKVARQILSDHEKALARSVGLPADTESAALPQRARRAFR